jgi:hypothetical protein
MTKSANKTQYCGQQTKHNTVASKQNTILWSVNKAQYGGQQTKHNSVASKKDKIGSTKHYTENIRLFNPYLTRNQG